MDRLDGAERSTLRRLARRVGWMPALGMVAMAALVPLPGRVGASAPPDVSRAESLAPLCIGDAGQAPPSTSSFALTAQDGYILTPDLNSIYMWSYSSGSNAFQYPGPAICVTQGDTVTVSLRDNLPVPTSINFIGINNVTFSGLDDDGSAGGTPISGPATPTANDLADGNLGPSIFPNSVGTYSFVASQPGTYLYESGTSPELQDQMGLVGTLIVRPNTNAPGACPAGWQGSAQAGVPAGECKSPTGDVEGEVYAASATGKVSTLFNPDREFMHMLTEVDPDLHACFEEARLGRTNSQSASDGTFTSLCNAKQAPYTYDMTLYKARYWFINGRSFPDTIAPNNSAHLPSQPYSALVHVTPRSANDTTPAVVRYLNAGPIAYPFHPHSQHEMYIGEDGRPRVKAVSTTGSSAGGMSLTVVNPGPVPQVGQTVTVGTQTTTVTSVSGQTVDVKDALAVDPPGTTVSWIDDLTNDHFGLTIPPGHTVDTMFSWVDAVGWDPATRPISFGGTTQGFADIYAEAPEVIVPQQQDRINGELWSGTPYLGYRTAPKTGGLNSGDSGSGPSGADVQFNECGEYYDIAHSHALYEITNFGQGVGGMLTFIRIDPVGGCPQ
jgi:FtsP/CotA-like multicopper oxidase with cupredoxin domain